MNLVERNRVSAALVLLALLCARPAAADGPLAYFSTYGDDSFDSGVVLHVDALSWRAGMTTQLLHGRTVVSPRLTSTWAPTPRLDMHTLLEYPDLNSGLDAGGPTADSRIDLGTPLSLFGGDPLGFEAGLDLPAGADAASSQLRSSFGVGPAVHVTATISSPAASGVPAPAPQNVDTRLTYTPHGLLNRVQGSIERTADGARDQSLSIGLPGMAGAETSARPFSLHSRATVAETVQADGTAAWQVGLATNIANFTPGWLGGKSALSLQLERYVDAAARDGASLAYEQSWKPTTFSSIGLDLQLSRQPDAVEPSMRLHWNARF